MNVPAMDDTIREKIIADPTVLLEDHDIMRALVAANDTRQGDNVVDLRAIAMSRLEQRFDRLEDTHRNVIAAAYDNLAGTNQVHRAILRMLDADSFAGFLGDLTGDVAAILRVDHMRIVLEGDTAQADDSISHVVTLAADGFVDDYITMGRNTPVRQVTLRAHQGVTTAIYGDHTSAIQSEACLKLDMGPGRSNAMLVMGAEDPHLFHPQQGTDLLGFFAGVLERALRRWLA